MNSSVTCFSMIGLVLSLFGGTYAAMSSIRTFFDPIVKDEKTLCDKHLFNFKDKFRDKPDLLKKADTYCKDLSFWQRCYNASQIAPTVWFALFAFGMTIFCSLINSNANLSPNHELWFKIIQWFSLLVNSSSLLLLWRSIIKIKTTNSGLKELFDLLVSAAGNIQSNTREQIEPASE